MARLRNQVSTNATKSHYGPRKVFTLPVEEIHPIVRMAHRRPLKTLAVERIIFDHEFVLFLDGDGTFIIDGVRYEIRPHQLFFIRPYHPDMFELLPTRSSDHIAVHFDLKPGFPPFAHHLSRRPPYEVRLSHGLELPTYVTLSTGHPVEQCLIDLVRTYTASSPTAMLEVSSLLLRAILLLLRGPPAAAGPTARSRLNTTKIRRVVEHIECHITDELSTDTLARVADLSAGHLARQFLQWAGQTPADYVRHVRIAKARTLLAEGELSIKEIATATGFKNPYHFSRVFRQIDGLSPTLFRETFFAKRK